MCKMVFVIGSNYATSSTPPTDGLLVEGNTNIDGDADVNGKIIVGGATANEKVNVNGSTEISGEYKYKSAKTRYFSFLGKEFNGDDINL